MKKLLLLLLPVISWGQTPVSDTQIKLNTDYLIRKAGTVLRQNHALINDQLTDSKVSIIAPNLKGSSTTGYVWTATDNLGNGNWLALPPSITQFQLLTDGPGSYTSHALNYTRVNTGATSLEYRTPSQVLSDISGVPTSRQLTINGVAFDLSADRSWTIAAGVTSFNSRTGAIIPQSGDYSSFYAPQTSGAAILYGNGSGGFSNVSIGANLTFSGGTLAASGGFVNPMTTLGDIIYEDATPTAVRLAGNTTSTKKFLTQTGNGSISAIPTWNTIAAGDVPTLNQNTTGSAATLTNARTIQTNLASTSSASFDGSSNITPGVSGTLAVTNGGTGVTVSSGASSVVLRDANQNITANNAQLGYTTTVTAAGTTTLTVSSTRNQYFTGTTTQTVLMPVTSTLVLGHPFFITNNSTGAVTVQSSGANAIQVMQAGSSLELKVISTSGTTASSWAWEYHPSNPMTGTGDIIVGLGSGEPGKLSIGAANNMLLTVVSGTPGWVAGVTGTATNDNAAAGIVGEHVSSLIAVGSATSLTTATPKNVTSISLTAGDWDVRGNINFTESSATVTARTGGISSTSATLPSDGSEVEIGFATTTLTEKVGTSLPSKRFSLSGTTTIYLVASATFSAGTNSAYGSITARRVR